MAKKKQKDVDDVVRDGYKKAKKTAKKHGKLKQFYIALAVIIILAVAGFCAYYFMVIKPLEESKCIITTSVDGIEQEYAYYPGKDMPTIASPTPNKGYDFEGWYLDASLTNGFDSNKFIENPTKTLTIYPKFVPKTFEIKLSSDNIIVDTINFTYNTAFPDLMTPVKEGGKFVGWYFDKEYTKKFVLSEFNNDPKNITLYAKFTVEYFKFDTYETIDTSKEPNLINRNALDIYFLDVDQADAALILLPDGRNMLIDAGDDNDITENHLKDVLKRFNITTIDYMMLTHTDSDHVGSMDEILRNYEVKNIFMPKLLPSRNAGTPKNRYDFITPEMTKGVINTQVYYDFFTLADDETYKEDGIDKNTKLFINAGFMEIIGKDYTLEIYCMDEDVYDRVFDTPKEKNEVSPSVILEYHSKKTLFTGDACGTSHTDFEEKYKMVHGTSEMDFDVYKVAHHGSGTHGSNNLEFLEAINTEYAIISCKESDKYDNIPHPLTIYYLQNTKPKNKVYRTDKCGDIRLFIDNNGKMTLTADSETDDDTIFTLEELKEEPPMPKPKAA